MDKIVMFIEKHKLLMSIIMLLITASLLLFPLQTTIAYREHFGYDKNTSTLTGYFSQFNKEASAFFDIYKYESSYVETSETSNLSEYYGKGSMSIMFFQIFVSLSIIMCCANIALLLLKKRTFNFLPPFLNIIASFCLMSTSFSAYGLYPFSYSLCISILQIIFIAVYYLGKQCVMKTNAPNPAILAQKERIEMLEKELAELKSKTN